MKNIRILVVVMLFSACAVKNPQNKNTAQSTINTNDVAKKQNLKIASNIKREKHSFDTIAIKIRCGRKTAKFKK